MREEIEDFQDEMEEILRNLHIDTAMSESAIAGDATVKNQFQTMISVSWFPPLQF